jgi:hypothetical protein
MTDYYSNFLQLINSEKKNFKGAGFIFYSRIGLDISILLGQDNKSKSKIPSLSVFGGGKESFDKNSIDTAVRETFEELFNVRPNGLDLFVEQIQQKIDNNMIVEKVFVKSNNEVCYFADINILNMFIDHLIYQSSPWTFKGDHNWLEYKNNYHNFINDRILKPNEIARNGLNEITKIYLVKLSDLLISIKNDASEKIVKINNKKFKLRDNLNRYLQESIIIDIINKLY